MKQPTALISFFATGLLLASVLTCLAVNSHEKDLCRNPSIVPDSCSEDLCNVVASPRLAAVKGPTPTLAPPRPDSMQIGSSQETSKGQEIFLQVETDHNLNDFEISLATP
jgi:hypothetical protein